MASKKVTKSDLVQKVFENSNFTKKEIQSVTDELINQIKKSLEEKSTIEIRGFGTFEVKSRGERTGRNPKTGEAVVIPATKYPVFTASKSLKQSFK